MRRLFAVPVNLVASIAAVGTLSACQMLAANAAMDFNLSLAPTLVTAPPGGEALVTVKIGHLLPVDVVPMPVMVTLHDPPDYVSAEDLEIPSGIESDELTIVVADDAPVGTTVTLEVRATNSLKTKEASFELTIGESGVTGELVSDRIHRGTS